MTIIVDPTATHAAADRKLRRATWCVRVVLTVALLSVALWFGWRSFAAPIAAASQTPFLLALEIFECAVMGVLALMTIPAISAILAELAVIGVTTWLSAQRRAALISRFKTAFNGYVAPQSPRHPRDWTLIAQWLATSATAAVMIWVFSGEIKMLIVMLPARPTAHSLLLLIQIAITAFAMMKSAPLAIAFVDTASRRFAQATHARNDRGTVK